MAPPTGMKIGRKTLPTADYKHFYDKCRGILFAILHIDIISFSGSLVERLGFAFVPRLSARPFENNCYPAAEIIISKAV